MWPDRPNWSTRTQAAPSITPGRNDKLSSELLIVASAANLQQNFSYKL
jgi:hypothetical protein